MTSEFTPDKIEDLLMAAGVADTADLPPELTETVLVKFSTLLIDAYRNTLVPTRALPEPDLHVMRVGGPLFSSLGSPPVIHGYSERLVQDTLIMQGRRQLKLPQHLQTIEAYYDWVTRSNSASTPLTSLTPDHQIRWSAEYARALVQFISKSWSGQVTDSMVDAYLKEQRRVVEEADRTVGRPNVGGLHTDTVREACRSGIVAALGAE